MRPRETEEHPLIADRFIAESMATSCDDLLCFARLIARAYRRAAVRLLTALRGRRGRGVDRGD